MKCLRSGRCCSTMMVVIVDDPKLGLVESNLIMHEGKGPCKHLQGDEPGKYSCAVHDYPWYKDTPCYSHGQIEYQNSNCRLGEFILKRSTDGVKIRVEKSSN